MQGHVAVEEEAERKKIPFSTYSRRSHTLPAQKIDQYSCWSSSRENYNKKMNFLIVVNVLSACAEAAVENVEPSKKYFVLSLATGFLCASSRCGGRKNDIFTKKFVETWNFGVFWRISSEHLDS